MVTMGRWRKSSRPCVSASLTGCASDSASLSDFGREDVRQVMLADDDFDVDAEIAGAAENFDDAAGRRSAAARKAQNLDVDDGAVEFVDARNAACAR